MTATDTVSRLETVAAALALAEERLRDSLRITAIIADMRGKRLSPSCPPVLDEEGQHEFGLLPGDLDGEA